MDNSKVKQSILLAVLPGGSRLILEYTDSIYSKKEIAKLKGGIKEVSKAGNPVLQKIPTIQEMIDMSRSES